MVKVNIPHMWDFTVMPLQKHTVEVKLTNQDLQKQYPDFVLLAIFFPAKKVRGGGKREEKKAVLRKHMKLSNP